MRTLTSVVVAVNMLSFAANALSFALRPDLSAAFWAVTSLLIILVLFALDQWNRA